jgi:hypothetical protein
MIVILGAGISGLMLAQRLRAAKRKFVLLDKAGMMKSGNDQGFFYAHAPNPFTEPNSFKIISDACDGGTVEKYAEKVYGDPKANLDSSSYARFGQRGRIETGQGWKYSLAKLTEGVSAIISEVDCVDLSNRVVYDTEGRAWKYSSLLSTIPLPVLYKISILGNKPFVAQPQPKFNHIPITVSINHCRPEWMKADQTEREMRVHYCASDCHEFYRIVSYVNPFHGSIEYKGETTGDKHSGVKLFPGKIWIPSDEKIGISALTDYFKLYDVALWGRYGAWRPKGLTSHVWEESEGLGGRLP